MTFWVDQPTGQLWVRGGALFAVILVVTIALRFGANYVLTGGFSSSSSFTKGNHPTSSSLAADISADLLFLSLGLWAARAVLLFQRRRAFLAGAPQA